MLLANQILITTLVLFGLVACGGGGTAGQASGAASSMQDANAMPAASSGASGATGQSAPGSEPTKALAARFTQPNAIAIDDSGNLYVADSGTIREITPSGEVRTIAGAWQKFGAFNDRDDGVGAAARFNDVTDMAVDRAGNLYVTETIGINGRIRKVTTDHTVTTILHDVLAGGITSDTAGTVYFTTQAPRYIGYFDSDGAVQRIVDPTSPQYDAIGKLLPHGLVVDAARHLYVISKGSLRSSPGAGPGMGCSVEKIAATGTMTTFVGKRQSTELENTCGSIDGQGASASIRGRHLAIGAAGNLYIADLTTVRKVTPDGTVSTLAGRASTPNTDTAVDGIGAAG
jgi:hypothetical protein